MTPVTLTRGSASGSSASTCTPTPRMCAGRWPALGRRGHSPSSTRLTASPRPRSTWVPRRELANRSHHLLLLTATPHRGKEHFFRGLLNLLDPTHLPVGPPAGRLRDSAAPVNALLPAPDEGGAQGSRGQPALPAAVCRDRPRFAQRCRAGRIPRGHGLRRRATTERTRRSPRSIYGKRAASSLVAAEATIRRRHEAVKGPAAGRTDAPIPDEFAGADGELSLAVDDDDAWERAEDDHRQRPHPRQDRGTQRDQWGARTDPAGRWAIHRNGSGCRTCSLSTT